MKIFKMANEFEDEGFDLSESPNIDEFEAQHEFETEQQDLQEGRKGATNTFKIQTDLTKSNVFDEQVGIYSVAEGSVGWYRYKDGTVYEVLIAPVAYSKYKDLYKTEKLHQTTQPIDFSDQLL